jgi:hypothetical protein
MEGYVESERLRPRQRSLQGKTLTSVFPIASVTSSRAPIAAGVRQSLANSVGVTGFDQKYAG